MPPFKDEHILIIAPGSQTTLAQLGLPESFTPARFRFPTRMFPSNGQGEWEPFRIRKRIIQVPKAAAPAAVATDTNGAEPKAEKDSDGDQHMADRPSAAAPAEGEVAGQEETQEQKAGEEKEQGGESKPTIEQPTETQEEIIYEEDVSTDEGCVRPLEEGRIVNWSCFFSLLTHIYNTLSPPFHTPIMLISQPVWSVRDREIITQFIFEKFKTPAFCMMDSALAVCYAYGTPTGTVIDVGHQKVDVTAVTDFMVNEHGRGIAVSGCGGETMTSRLHQLLRSKGFTWEMCEQVKRSNIAEILPAGTPLPGDAATASQIPNPAATSVTGAGGKDAKTGEARATNGGGDNGEEDEGVLDVAAIVSGNTSEFLAQREKEKAEKAAASKKGSTEQAGKAVRQPNSKREKASFQYQELLEVEPKSGTPSTGTNHFIRHTREIEVGVERFLLASPPEGESIGLLDTIAAQIHQTIHSVTDATKRSELWDSLIILGNGSKIRGFTPSLLGVINQKYLLSPSSGTIFTSEIPSNMSTPLATGGTNTPVNSMQTPPGPMYHPAAHGVNPLLVAATHANNPTSGNDPNMSPATHAMYHHRSTGHSQTPTSVKTLKPPEYFPEWKDSGSGNAAGGASGAGASAGAVGSTAGIAASGAGGLGGASGSQNVGMEEATFLGAQVAAKVVFVIDQGLSKGFMSRAEFNESGPFGIHDFSL